MLTFLPGLSMHNEPTKTVNDNEYQIFLKEFVFDKLQGKSLGQSFCERFDINDHYLKQFSDETAKYHIEKLGYIK